MRTAGTAAMIFASALLCGCQSVYRPRFDIDPDNTRAFARRIDGGPYVVVEVRRFAMRDFACNLTSGKNYPCQEVIPGSKVMPELIRLFPSLFADTPNSVPIIVMQNIRSGAVASSGGGLTVFEGAAGFNKNLSRMNRSEMASPVSAGVSPQMYLNGLVSTWTLFIVPLYGGEYSSHYDVSIMTGYDAYGESVSYSASAGVWTINPVFAPLFPETAGWIHNDASAMVRPQPDATDAQKSTALCCAIVSAMAKLSPAELDALRANPVALLRDKEMGGNRAFKLVQVAPERDVEVRRMGEDILKPGIVSQLYDPATRRGFVVFNTAECPDEKVAVAWVRESYIPLIASQKGGASDASAPAHGRQDSVRFSITGFKKEAGGRFRIDFTVQN